MHYNHISTSSETDARVLTKAMVTIARPLLANLVRYKNLWTNQTFLSISSSQRSAGECCKGWNSKALILNKVGEKGSISPLCPDQGVVDRLQLFVINIISKDTVTKVEKTLRSKMMVQQAEVLK